MCSAIRFMLVVVIVSACGLHTDTVGKHNTNPDAGPPIDQDGGSPPPPDAKHYPDAHIHPPDAGVDDGGLPPPDGGSFDGGLPPDAAVFDGGSPFPFPDAAGP